MNDPLWTGENTGDNRGENYGENYGDNGGDNHGEPHGENHGESHGETHGENLGENHGGEGVQPPKAYVYAPSDGEESEVEKDKDKEEEPLNLQVTSAVYELASYTLDPDQAAVLSPRIPTTVFLPNFDTSSNARDQPKPAITIHEAVKSHDMGGSAYIGYIIRTDLPDHGLEFESKHRYSEFEGLRKLLVRAYPTSVVPPIPEKHNLVDYVGKPGRAKEDPKMILKRKRMLQTFLNRVAAHPILCGAPFFHRFLKGDAPWSEIVATSGLAHLLKKNTAINVNDRTVLKKPDPHFKAAQDYTRRFSSQIGFILKTFKRISGHYDAIIETHSQLGAAYNGWSLTESALAEPLEQTGQAIDSIVTATQIVTGLMNENVTEGLLEFANYGYVIDKLLLWRHKKHGQFEATSENLIYKQTTLAKLESSEHESQRLAAVLSAEGSMYSGSRPTSAIPVVVEPAAPGYGAGVPIGAPTPSTGSSGGFMKTLNSFIDHDPEQTRRNNISKTKDAITALEESRETIRQELLKANSEIQADLDRFQKQKISDLRNMLISMAFAQKEYHAKALNAWKTAKMHVEKM